MKKRMTLQKFDRMLFLRTWIELALALILCLPFLYYHFIIRPNITTLLSEAKDSIEIETVEHMVELPDFMFYVFIPVVVLCFFMTCVDFHLLLKARRKLLIKELPHPANEAGEQAACAE